VKLNNQESGEGWIYYNSDCVPVMSELPDNSVHFSIASPPYLSLYTYSSLAEDMGNCDSDEKFWQQFRFAIKQLFRVIKPGRIVAMDCMNVPAMKERDGYIGIKDFRGDLIREFIAHGFIFHSEHCMWKDPLIEATRSKALGLMHKQLMKDSAMCRAGLAQYLLAFRKPGVNPEPIAHADGLEYFRGLNPPEHGNLSHERWRRYASPVWDDIDWSNTLNVRDARDDEDERHLCAIPLDIPARGLQLWSNPGDTVLTPFGGIASEGYVALQEGRRYIGCETKPAYWAQGVKNLKSAGKQLTIFSAHETP
jgi:DNA modification methylase